MSHDLFSEMDALLRGLFPAHAYARPRVSGSGLDHSAPVDLFLRDNAAYLIFDLPGVDKESISVKAEGSTVYLTAERRSVADPTDEVLLTERAFGTLRRSIRLPRRVLTTAVTATYQDGVLQVIAPFEGKSEGSEVEVRFEK